MALHGLFFCAVFALVLQSHGSFIQEHSHDSPCPDVWPFIVCPCHPSITLLIPSRRVDAALSPLRPIQTFLPSPELYRVQHLSLLVARTGRYVYRPAARRRLTHSIIALLLLRSGVESNPGPATSVKSRVNVGLLNTRSLVKNASLVQDMIGERELDMLVVTETWVSSDAPDVIKLGAVPEGYSIVHEHRSGSGATNGGVGRRGGGLAIIYRNIFDVRVLEMTDINHTTFELMLVRLSAAAESVVLAAIYRPPASSVNIFCSELSDMLDTGGALGNRFVLLGDFNCPGNDAISVDTSLGAFIDRYNIIQHVTEPTRQTARSESLLDLVLTPDDCDLISSINVTDPGISDHSLVAFQLDIKRPHKIPAVQISVRNFKDLNVKTFADKMSRSETVVNPCDNVDDYCDQLHRDITDILDVLAPRRSVTKHSRLHTKCALSSEALAAKRRRRRLERRWKSSRLEADRLKFRAACRSANALIRESKTADLTAKINSSSSDSRSLWRTVKTILHPARETACIKPGWCQTLADFFDDKIANVRTSVCSKLSGDHGRPDTVPARPHTGDTFERFIPVTIDEATRVILQLSDKTSPLDLIPTSLLKACHLVFSPIVAKIANLSFSTGTFPMCYKEARVTPIIKKHGLDGSDPSNYRPISNLSTMSKLIERLCLSRLSPHLMSSPNFSTLQSAYRKNHSTETALIKILDDLYLTLDNKSCAVMVGLDISAAFDTIDHQILLDRLKLEFGVSDIALNWINSYLDDRTQYLCIGANKSTISRCTVGVPQGSVLGPLLFTAYTSPIAHTIRSYGVSFHQYADDTLLYTAVHSQSLETDIVNLERCTDAVMQWFLENGMKLNPDKSVAMLLAARAQSNKLSGLKSVKVGGVPITFSTSLKCLGVTLDSTLILDGRIQEICKENNFHIRALRHIRPLLTESTAASIGASIVGSRLDYCNSLLAHATEHQLDKLQRVQNSLARVVTKSKKRDHIKPVLARLHWLPVRQRIDFKLATTVHKVRDTKQPEYLADLLVQYVPNRTLRSQTGQLLNERQTRTVHAARAFGCAAPKLWNSLSIDVKNALNLDTFKNRLKTSLYISAFSHAD
jgi:Reverse transcriptase (RNA-dependent DNA polymerase)/Endonuclease-reverse transcriptase